MTALPSLALTSLCLLLASPAPALAQASPAIGFNRVAEALSSLEARDGNGTIVTHRDGWAIVNEPLAAAQWSFTPVGHAAYPALVRRIIRRGADGSVSVDTASLCEAPAAACEALVVEFKSLDERITQAVKARGRQGSSSVQP